MSYQDSVSHVVSFPFPSRSQVSLAITNVTVIPSPLVTTFEQAIEAGMTGFGNLVGVWRGRFRAGVNPPGDSNMALEVVEAVAIGMDYEAIRRLAGQMAQQQIWNCPTLITD